jgi:hypothetical protein
MTIDEVVQNLKSELNTIEKDLTMALYKPVYRPLYDVNREPLETKRVTYEYIGTFNGDMTALYHSVDMLVSVVGDYKHYAYMFTEGDAQELTARILACRDTIVSFPETKFSKVKIAKKVYNKRYGYYLKVTPLTKSSRLGGKLEKLYSEAP